MFKSRFSELIGAKYKHQPYCIAFEGNPDISKGVANQIWYENFFSNRRDALSIVKKIDLFLDDVFFIVDTYYFRILALGNYDFEINYSNTQYSFASNDVQMKRNKILHNSLQSRDVSTNIIFLTNYINSLIQFVVYYSRENKNIVSKIFDHLQKLKEYFIKSYRNYSISGNEQNLIFLNVLSL